MAVIVDDVNDGPACLAAEGPALPAPGGGAAVRALTIGAVALISLIAFEALAVATVMPTVAADLDGLSVYALAFGAPMATSVVGMALAGAWSDGVGARRPLAVGVVLFAVGLLLCGSAPSIALFVLGRGVQGLGGGMQIVALYALVGSVVPEPRRPRLFAWFSAAWVLPAMLGPAVSGLLLHTVGWRPVFLIVPALTIPAWLVMWPAVRGSKPLRDDDAGGSVGRGAVRRRVLLAAGAGASAATLQVLGTSSHPWARGLSVVAFGAVLWCSWRLLPAGLFRLQHGLPAVVAVRGLIGASFAGADTFLPLLLVRRHGWDPAVAGLVLTVGATSWSAGSWLQGRYPATAARYRLSRLGTAMLATGVATIVVMALPGVPVWIGPIGWAVAGCGIGMTYSSTSFLALHLSPSDRHGESSSALTTSESLTSAVVLAIGGALFALLLPTGVGAAGATGSAPFVAGISVALLAGLLSIVAAWRMSPPPQTRSTGSG
jgi:MFS family permease